MTNEQYHQRGRADAAEGKNNPPYGNIFTSDKTTEERRIGREHYREGHADKTREMEEEKKKHG